MSYDIKNNECLIVNIDNGDIFDLGKLVSLESYPEYGLDNSHPGFTDIFSKQVFDHPFNTKLREAFCKNSTHFNYFLACSIGCRLIVMSVDEFDDIVYSLGQEIGCGIMYIFPNGENFKSYFNSRNKAILAPANRYKPESGSIVADIKRAIKNGLVYNNAAGYMEYRSGNFLPDSVFFDRIDRRDIEMRSIPPARKDSSGKQ